MLIEFIRSSFSDSLVKSFANLIKGKGKNTEKKTRNDDIKWEYWEDNVHNMYSNI